MKRFDSYVLYAVFFLISIFWSWRYDIKKRSIISLKTKIIYCIFITVPIIILQGFRYNVGADYFSYLSLYKGFAQGNKIFLKWYQSEPLFILFCKVVYTLTAGNEIGYFIAIAILMNILLFVTFDYYKDQINLPLMYFVYYMLCFPYFLNVERQGLAVIIVWYATKYIHEKRLVKFIGFILVASLIHNTAIIALSLCLVDLYHGKYGKYIKRILIALLLFSPFILETVINYAGNHLNVFQRYKKFLRVDEEITKVNVNLIYMAFMIFVLTLFIKLIKTSRIDYAWILFLLIAQLISYMLDNYIDWGFRMSFYFEFGMMFAYSFVYANSRKRINRAGMLTFLAVSLLFYFTYKFYIQGNGAIFPYQFYKIE